MAVAAPAFAAVRETVKNETYTGRGETVAEARADLSRRRPKPYDAWTDWRVEWKYTYATSPGRCAFRSVDTTLAIHFIFPQLETNNSAIRRSFDGYVVNLHTHENGHADHARLIAGRIDAEIRPMTAPTCEALGRNANALGDRFIDEGRQFDVDYDKRTDHGRTQGARWP